MCSELDPHDPEVKCDMTWTHTRKHGNMAAGSVWITPRPVSAADLRTEKMREIKRAVQSSD